MAFALFIAYVVLSHTHPGEIVPALAPYRITYWIGITALTAAAASLVRRRGGPIVNLQLVAVMLLTAVMAASLMVAERWAGAPILVLQRFGPSLTIFVLAVCTVTSLDRLRIATGCVIALTIALMLQGAAAYHLGYNSQLFLMDRTTTEETADDAVDNQAASDSGDQALPDSDIEIDIRDAAQGRESSRIQALGFMNDPNDLAMALVVGLGLIGGLWTHKWRLPDVFLAAAAGAFVYGIYLTRSRGGMVALVVVLWRIAASRVSRAAAFAVLVALGAGATALDFGGRTLSTELDASASERLVAWGEGFEMLKSQPMLGVGYGQFLDHHTLTAHNSLVLAFAETGLVGCFFWVGLFVVTLLELRTLRQLRGPEPFDRNVRRLAEGLQLSLIGFATAACLLSRTFVPTLYLVIGLSAALASIARNANRSVPLPPLPGIGMLVLACEVGGIGILYMMVKLYGA